MKKILIYSGLIGAVWFACFFMLAGCDDSSSTSSIDTLYVVDTTPPTDQGYGNLKYVGSAECESCHQENYDMFRESGHPYKLNKVVNGVKPTYPAFVPPIKKPVGTAWSDFSYVIGGYGWKARFVKTDGYIYTPDAGGNQYNLADGSWGNYHPGEEKPYDCGSCHTTGYDPDGDSQDGLAGIVGSWAEPGVQCEECHGAGSYHVDSKGLVPLKVDRSKEACGSCHYRGGDDEIPAKGGFIQHHEQFNELVHATKASMSCVDCHNPHASTKYDSAALGKGIKQSCETCHAKEKESYMAGSPSMYEKGITCVDCHMAKVTKSAIKEGEFRGDVKSHLFRISTDSTERQFNADSTQANSFISLEFACLGCHGTEADTATVSEEFRNQSKGWASIYAKTVHHPIGAPTYSGSKTCAECHQAQYDIFIESGHPYKLNKVVDGKAPTYPSFVPPMILPEGLAWADVTYVIGGYGWKARFLDQEGYIWGTATGAGAGNQFNLVDSSYSDYHATDASKKKFDCGACHTTGYDVDAPSQDGLEGVVGAWAEPGVQCEACHGPGSLHIASRGAIRLSQDGSAAACGSCHYRGDIATIPSKGGYIQHHEQYNEILHAGKAFMACTDCHDPHASSRYDADAKGLGVRTSCETCHAKEADFFAMNDNHSNAGVGCVDCHMPKITKSAKAKNMLVGDVSTHIFRISTDSTAQQFNADSTSSMGYVSLDFACLSCHGDPAIAPENVADSLTGKDKIWAAENAMGRHSDKSSIEYADFKKLLDSAQADTL